MLTFVGLGLYDERSITIEGADALDDADRAFAEFYTSDLVGTTVEELADRHGVPIAVRDRAGVERDPEPILDAAGEGNVCLLVAGDPMVSTTHVDLRLRALDRGIDTRVVHGVSAASAVPGVCGLQNYRFGRATTLPFPDAHGDGSVPGSVVDAVEGNRDRGLHTLVYLDIAVDDAERATHSTGTHGDYMTADEAADLLVDGWHDALGVAVARVGSPDPVVVADDLSRLADRDFGGPLHALVLPGALHHVEREALDRLGGAPTEALTAHEEAVE